MTKPTAPAPRFSIVVLTVNSLGVVEPLLEALVRQKFTEPVEYIFMDTSSTDGTVEYLRQVPLEPKRIVNVPRDKFSHSGTRMQAAVLARGEFVVFFTHDTVPIGEDFLQDLTAPVRNGLAPASQGVFQVDAGRHDPVDAYLHNRWYEDRPDVTGPVTPFAWEYFSPENRRRFAEFNDCASCINRSLLLELRFPPVSYGEDMLFAKRLLLHGYTLALAKRACFYHWHHVSFGYLLKRMVIDQYLSVREFDLYYVRSKWGVLKSIWSRSRQRVGISFFRLHLPWKQKIYWSAYSVKVLVADYIGKYIGQLPAGGGRGFLLVNHSLRALQQKIVAEIDEESLGRY